MLRIDLLNLQLDVISFCETWLKDSITDGLINMEGYKIVCADRSTLTPRKTVKSGGGLCVYYRSYFTSSDLRTVPIAHQISKL